jgi:hypothetical protein
MNDFFFLNFKKWSNQNSFLKARAENEKTKIVAFRGIDDKKKFS